MMEASKEVNWLRKRYLAAPSEGPSVKRIKFEEIYSGIRAAFPDTKHNQKMVSDAIKQSFPQSLSKPYGHSRAAHIFGLQVQPHPTEETPMSTSLTVPQQIDTVQELAREIETNRQLREQLRIMEERVRELEQAQAKSHLVDQMNALPVSSNAIQHGPDTIDHFTDLSMEKLLSECKQFAPDVLRILQTIGHLDPDSLGGEDLGDSKDGKVVMALCTLLKSRSRKVLGLQLLVSFMLVARSTSRQVRSFYNRINETMLKTYTTSHIRTHKHTYRLSQLSIMLVYVYHIQQHGSTYNN